MRPEHLKTKWLVCILIGSILLSSCINNKEIVLLQNKRVDNHKEDTRGGVFQTSKDPYLVRPGDVLYVEINAYDRTKIDIGNTNDRLRSSQNPNLDGVRVNERGKIDLPIIGQMEVAGKSLTEIEYIIRNEAKSYVANPSVKAFLINFNVTVMGEVVNPGVYQMFKNDPNVMDAIATAGGFDRFGRPDLVKIVREEADTARVYYVNMTDQRLLASNGFYIMPNDVVYVKPFKNRKVASLAVPTVISAISTAAVIVSIILSNSRP